MNPPPSLSIAPAPAQPITLSGLLSWMQPMCYLDNQVSLVQPVPFQT
jgi:hypothetical protein